MPQPPLLPLAARPPKPAAVTACGAGVGGAALRGPHGAVVKDLTVRLSGLVLGWAQPVCVLQASVKRQARL